MSLTLVFDSLVRESSGVELGPKKISISTMEAQERKLDGAMS